MHGRKEKRTFQRLSTTIIYKGTIARIRYHDIHTLGFSPFFQRPFETNIFIITFLYPSCRHHTLIYFRNSLRRVQTLGASRAAVENGVAAVQGRAVVQLVLKLLCLLVTAVGYPAVALHQHGRAKVLLRVSPVAGEAHRMHSYRPSSLARSACDWMFSRP